MYDPQIGRWHVPDVLGEIRTHESPYCYVGNNPISRIDPDGRKWKDDKDENQAKNDIKSLEKTNTKLSDKIVKYDQKIEKASADGKNSKVERLELKKADAGNRIVYNTASISSINKMGADPNKTFRFGNTFSSQTQGNLTYSKATMARDADGTYVINNLGSLGNRVHEETHGGQIADGLFDIAPGTDKVSTSSVSAGWAETQAYRAEYAVSGSVFFPVKELMEINPRTIHEADPITYPSLR